MSWRKVAYRTARPLLFRVDPERIHHLTLRALARSGESGAGRGLCRLASGCSPGEAARAPVDLLGLRFRNRVGLAAGFDKDGAALRGWAALGLGFVEAGTVTPQPQAGSPRPRLFRLAADHALLNRMGFNNAGAAALARRVAAARPHLPDGFVVGVNIGRGRETSNEEAMADYLAAARAVAPVADYLAVNVSSPNTPGLRGLQQPHRLVELLARLEAVEPRRPLLVKLDPDLDEPAFAGLIRALVDSPASGLVLSNTSLARNRLQSLASVLAEEGGISGEPIRERARQRIAAARAETGARFVIIASGGIGSASHAQAAIDAGADLVQIWTGLVYRGPGLIGELVRRVQ